MRDTKLVKMWRSIPRRFCWQVASAHAADIRLYRYHLNCLMDQASQALAQRLPQEVSRMHADLAEWGEVHLSQRYIMGAHGLGGRVPAIQ